jgi:uncharacterized protein YciI
MLKKSHLLISVFILSFFFGSIETFAQNKLFLVTLSSNPERVELSSGNESAIHEGHLENIDRLYKEGDLLLAGPFDRGGGIFVLQAASLDDAIVLLDSDPAISANRFIVETQEMEIEKGWICVQDRPYEMIMLNYIRYTSNDAGTNEVPFDEHYGYVQTDDVLLSAAVKNGSDIEYIIILPQEVDASSFAGQDPLVSSGNYTFEIRSWWATDKTFCSDKSKKFN